MSKFTMNIIRKNGRWLVNDKNLKDLNRDEKEFMDAFFKEVKLSRIEEDQEVIHFINRKSSDQSASIKYAALLK